LTATLTPPSASTTVTYTTPEEYSWFVLNVYTRALAIVVLFGMPIEIEPESYSVT
jgi:hypothetical protein